MAVYDRVFAEVKKLSLDDKLKLLDELSLEIPEDAWPAISEECVEEFDRRVQEMRDGTVEIVPWETVLEEIDQKLGSHRAN
jgi:putative addiction module component (TIGR02574 family)